MSVCSVAECSRERYGLKEWCDMHYKRWKRTGTPEGRYGRHGRGSDKDTTHGTWRKIKGRCNNPNDPKYESYGGRGIKVCDRWLGPQGFANFLKDMGDKPSPFHSIDRIDNDGDYAPDNCRWATVIQQARNKGLYKTNSSGYSDIYLRHNKWYAYISVNGKRKSLGSFDTKEDAIQARQRSEKELWT